MPRQAKNRLTITAQIGNSINSNSEKMKRENVWLWWWRLTAVLCVCYGQPIQSNPDQGSRQLSHHTPSTVVAKAGKQQKDGKNYLRRGNKVTAFAETTTTKTSSIANIEQQQQEQERQLFDRASRHEFTRGRFYGPSLLASSPKTMGGRRGGKGRAREDEGSFKIRTMKRRPMKKVYHRVGGDEHDPLQKNGSSKDRVNGRNVFNSRRPSKGKYQDQQQRQRTRWPNRNKGDYFENHDPTPSPPTTRDPTVTPSPSIRIVPAPSTPTSNLNVRPTTSSTTTTTRRPSPPTIISAVTRGPTPPTTTTTPTSSPTKSPSARPISASAERTTIPPTVAPSKSPSSRAPTIPTLIPPHTTHRVPTIAPTIGNTKFPSDLPSLVPSHIPLPTSVPEEKLAAVTTPTPPPPSGEPSQSVVPTVLATIQWEQVQANYLFQSYRNEGFGYALKLSGDATTLTVGGFLNSEQETDGGRIVRYNLTAAAAIADDDDLGAGAMTEVYGETEFDYVGFHVETSKDGVRHAIYHSAGDEGIMKIQDYSKDQQDFELITEFVPPVNSASLDFALSGDGQWIVVVGEDYKIETGMSHLLLLLYEYNEQSKTFQRFGQPVTIDSFSMEEWGEFDTSITHDGSYMALSLIGSQELKGEVRVYERSASGLTLLGSPFKPVKTNEGFGRTVELVLSNERLVLAFSSPFDDTVYVFTKTSTSADWVPLGSPVNGIDHLKQACDFGYAISLNKSADRLLIGAPLYDKNSGLVLVYAWSGDEWKPLSHAISGLVGSQFGAAVDFDESGSNFAVGAPLDCLEENICGGSVYLFEEVTME